jgi:ABC-type transport system involved in cytochrome bd biosynthesis fused ATPase/permease subunit
VTHSAKYLPQCDKIVVMKNGAVSESGTYRELLKASGEFADFLIQVISWLVEITLLLIRAWTSY